MATLTIEVADKDRDLFEQLAKRLNAKIINITNENPKPNATTRKAIAEARAGNVSKIEDLDLLFKGL